MLSALFAHDVWLEKSHQDHRLSLARRLFQRITILVVHTSGLFVLPAKLDKHLVGIKSDLIMQILSCNFCCFRSLRSAECCLNPTGYR
jgi:hypothetical protein